MKTSTRYFVAALALASIPSCAQVDSEETGDLRAGLTALATGVIVAPANDATLGFEDASRWTPNNGGVAVSGVHTQGEHALALTPGGYMTLKSAKLAMNGAPKQVSFDLRLPKKQSNQSWYGQVQLFVDCPSRNVYNAPLGVKELTGMPVESWQSLSFSVPESVVSALDGKSYSDLTFTLVLNVPTPAGTYLVDNLRLRGPKELPLEFSVDADPKLGTPSLVSAPTGQTIPLGVSPSNPADAASVALAYYRSYGGSYQLVDPQNELVVAAVVKDSGAFAGNGLTHVKFQQVIKGLPVFGAETIVHLTKALKVLFAGGRTLPTPTLPTVQPAITAAQAEQAAKAALTQGELNGDRARLPVTPAALGVYSPILFGKPSGPIALAYRIEAFGYVSFVSAVNGGLLLRWDSFETALKRTTYDDHNDLDATKRTLVMQESSNSCPADADPEICALHEDVGQTYRFFQDKFGRDSDNGKGAALEAHGNNVQLEISCPNAHSDLTFCAGMVALDVVAHEFTHRVTSNTAKLAYQGESGALNESYSDVMATAIENGDPLLAQDTVARAGTGIRNMQRPEAFGQPWKYSKLVTTEDDHGGVHTNSGIPNHAAWLMMKGGEREGVRVNAIGVDKTASLYYFTLASLALPSTATMYEAALTTVQTCKVLAASDQNQGLTSADCQEAVQAFVATGMLGQIHIDHPVAGETVDYGGFGSGSFAATVVDQGAPTKVPPVAWASSVEGPLFVADPATAIFWQPLGPRDITATVKFQNGHSATAHVGILVGNSPPSLTITAPAEGDTIISGAPITLHEHATDSSDVTVPCGALRWSTNDASDVLSSTAGCSPSVTFGALGPRVIQLQASDSLGLPGSATRSITVIAAAPDSPPVPQIIQPNSNVIHRDDTVALVGAAFDPRGDTQLTYTWMWNGFVIGTGAQFTWRPVNTMPFHCGGVDGVLKLMVTDSGGYTGSLSYALRVLDPPC